MKEVIKTYLTKSGFNHKEINSTDVFYKDIIDGVQILININDTELNAFLNPDEVGEDGFPKFAHLAKFKKDPGEVDDMQKCARAVISVILQDLLEKYNLD